jgi:hypothetical protein
MNVKQAVAIAKSYVADLFGPEGAEDIGLEEVEPNFDNGEWLVTVGFSRPWDHSSPLFASVGAIPRRAYKVVRVRIEDGQVVAVRNRETKD